MTPEEILKKYPKTCKDIIFNSINVFSRTLDNEEIKSILIRDPYYLRYYFDSVGIIANINYDEYNVYCGHVCHNYRLYHGLKAENRADVEKSTILKAFKIREKEFNE